MGICTMGETFLYRVTESSLKLRDARGRFLSNVTNLLVYSGLFFLIHLECNGQSAGFFKIRVVDEA